MSKQVSEYIGLSNNLAVRVARLFNATLHLAGYVWLQADRSVKNLRYEYRVC